MVYVHIPIFIKIGLDLLPLSVEIRKSFGVEGL